MSAEGDEPVVVHLTVCKEHVRGARRWLQQRTDEPVDTYGTELFLDQFESVQRELAPTPIYRMTRTG